jgi:hypothetical protein
VVVPVPWREERAQWFTVLEMVIQDVVDDVLNNKWQIKALPLGTDILRVTWRDQTSGDVLWRTEDTNGVVTGAGMYPSWMIVSITVV